MIDERTARSPSFRWCFGASLLLHGLVLLALGVTYESSPTRPRRETIPTKVRLVQRASGPGASSDVPDQLSLGDVESPRLHNPRAVRGVKLPEEMVSANSPRDRARKPSVIERRSKSRPSTTRPPVDPSTLSEPPPDTMKRIDVSEPASSSAEPTPAARMRVEQSKDFIGLGQGSSPQAPERRLLERPSFPYNRYLDLFPREATTVIYQLSVGEGGRVQRATVVRSSGHHALEEKLKKWFYKWHYEEGDNPYKVQVRLEIIKEGPKPSPDAAETG